jgi:FkbM family methyltransferase
MRRKFQEIISPRAFLYIRYLPGILMMFKNWIPFLLTYVGVQNRAYSFKLRNGMVIKTPDGMSSGTIMVVFVKKDYGDPPAENSVVIDIGANIGVYSLFVTQSKGTRVYAYEPMPENFRFLKENVALNSMEQRIIPFKYAISGNAEKRRLYLGESPLHSFLPVSSSPFNAKFSPSAPSAEQESIEVECVSLQQVFEANQIQICDLLKIDCEGAEYDILYNLPDVFFSRIKEIRLEYHNHLQNTLNTGDALAEFLKAKGFQIIMLQSGSPFQGSIWTQRT